MIKKALLIAFALLSLHSIAQRAVSGKVTNGEDNEPLVGVTVLVVGTTNGTITDFDGMYSLNNVPDGASIRYSYTGFQEQVVVVGLSLIHILLVLVSSVVLGLVDQGVISTVSELSAISEAGIA